MDRIGRYFLPGIGWADVYPGMSVDDFLAGQRPPLPSGDPGLGFARVASIETGARIVLEQRWSADEIVRDWIDSRFKSAGPGSR